MQTNFLATSQQWREAWQRNWTSNGLKRVRIAVAYCSRNGALELERAQQKLNVPVQLLVGLNDGVTDIFAREKLVGWAQSQPGVEVRGQFQTHGRFHPKLYIFELEHEIRILVGSVNLTKSAFHDNTEAALEWICPLPLASGNGVLTTFEAWWSRAQVLEMPGAIDLEVARLDLESRLVATMKQGVLVEIEAFLSPARGHFDSDVFNLGDAVRVQEGVLLVERLRQAQVLLIGKKTYDKLIQCREDAHASCRGLSFPCTAGHFVPVTALSRWKSEYHRTERRFLSLLEVFQTPEGRAKEQEQLRQELPGVISKVWKSVHGTSDVPAKNLDQITMQTLQQFEKHAPNFQTSVRLNLSLAPHPFPGMLGYTQTPSVVESELHDFAARNREEILRDWMTTLLTTTRQTVVLTLDQLLAKKKKPDTCARLREGLCQQLGWFNCYGDTFCDRVVETLKSHERTDSMLKELRAVADADLVALQNWPQMRFEEVLHDFSTRVGWL